VGLYQEVYIIYRCSQDIYQGSPVKFVTLIFFEAPGKQKQ